LLSLPTEHLIIFVNGKQVEGEEKELVLEKQRELRTEMHRLAGIGVVLTQRDGKFVVIPLPDTPAMKAGLLQGDVVTAIDGKSTEGLSLPDVVTRVRGVAGSTVTLSISRPRLAQPFEVKLIREEIKSHPEPSQAHEPTVKTSTIIMRKGADISPEELKRLGIITNAPSREASDER
jgi:C-terminal processing protease CtpA/Prc